MEMVLGLLNTAAEDKYRRFITVLRYKGEDLYENMYMCILFLLYFPVTH